MSLRINAWRVETMNSHRKGPLSSEPSLSRLKYLLYEYGAGWLVLGQELRMCLTQM